MGTSAVTECNSAAGLTSRQRLVLNILNTVCVCYPEHQIETWDLTRRVNINGRNNLNSQQVSGALYALKNRGLVETRCSGQTRYWRPQTEYSTN
jgi:hypothetical protein